MTRKEHLEHCKHCDHKVFNREKGLICSLTNDIADFDEFCDNFAGDPSLIVSKKEVKKEKRQRESFKPSSYFITKISNESFDLLSVFTPKKGYQVTPIIIIICIALFTIMALKGLGFLIPNIDLLLNWGANLRVKTVDGEWWRLITCNFLHFGILHLLINMFVLFYIGVILEPIIGKVKFLTSFLVTGIAASVVSVWWHDATISAGASGGIFGLYGVFIALLSLKIIEKEKNKKLIISTISFIAFNLILGLQNEIDNSAHIGGLISGIILGYAYYPSIIAPASKLRNIAISTLSIISLAAISLGLLSQISLAVITYDEKMDEFTQIEEKAMKFYNIMRYAKDQSMLQAIHEDGIPNWEKCKAIALEIKDLDDLSSELDENADLLIRYCNLRINSYTLMAKAIEEHTQEYNYKIEVSNKKIENIIAQIYGQEIDDEDSFYEHYDDSFGTIKEKPEPRIHPNALFVVDGIVQQDFSIEDLNNYNVESYDLLSGELAVTVYGDRAKDGAVLVVLK